MNLEDQNIFINEMSILSCYLYINVIFQLKQRPADLPIIGIKICLTKLSFKLLISFTFKKKKILISFYELSFYFLSKKKKKMKKRVLLNLWPIW